MSLGARDTRSAIIFLIKTIDRSPSSARARAVIAVYREQKRVEKNTRERTTQQQQQEKEGACERAHALRRCPISWSKTGSEIKARSSGLRFAVNDGNCEWRRRRQSWHAGYLNLLA